MVEFPDLEMAIALLPPLSRGLHLAAPRLHAERLIALWRSDGPVTLQEAFRLLIDVDLITGVILRTVAASEDGYQHPRHWRFPNLEALLPELRAIVWQGILAGRLQVEANGRTLKLAVVPSLTPDWQRSRLLRPKNPLAQVMVRYPPTVPIAEKPPAKKWRKREQPSEQEVKLAMENIVKNTDPNSPRDADWPWRQLQQKFPEITRERARQAREGHAPQLVRRRGRPTKPRSGK